MTLAVLTTAAHADPVAQAKQEVKTADIEFRLGRFTEALGGYTRAYQIYPVPRLLFNIAQCHRLLKDYDKAIFFYEGYLRDEPAATNRSLVEDLIRESWAGLAEQHRPPQPAAPEPPPAPAPMSPPAQTPAVAPVIAPGPDRPTTGPSALLPALLLGGGLAVITGGATLYYFGNKRGADEKYVYDDTRAIGVAMMAAGAAAIAAGAIVWLRQPSINPRRPSAALPPGGKPRSSMPIAAIGPGGGYVGWAGAF